LSYMGNLFFDVECHRVLSLYGKFESVHGVSARNLEY
jgi:hypothetical protein